MITVLKSDYMCGEPSFTTRANISTLSGFEPLDELSDGDTIRFNNFAELKCRLTGDPGNEDPERREDKEYPVYILINTEENRIISTSSQTFAADVKTFIEMAQDMGCMDGQNDAYMTIQLKRIPSKKNKGSFFRAAVLEVENDRETGISGN